MSFNLDDYVDVAERIRMFNEKYPEGSLQGKGFFIRDVEEKIIGYHYTASAYRTPDDPRPGIGTAYEPIPGKTPYTRDSEVMNAETSAWGRAIVALGFNTKKIASVEEVRARQNPVAEPKAVEKKPPLAAPVSQAEHIEPASATGYNYPLPPEVQEALDAKASSSVPAPEGYDGSPESMVVTIGTKHKGKRLDAVPRSYLEWLASEAFTPQTKDTRLLKNCAVAILNDVPVPAGDDDPSIPF
jgi:uncharacterized protein (DUF3820 family)